MRRAGALCLEEGVREREIELPSVQDGFAHKSAHEIEHLLVALFSLRVGAASAIARSTSSRKGRRTENRDLSSEGNRPAGWKTYCSPSSAAFAAFFPSNVSTSINEGAWSSHKPCFRFCSSCETIV